MEIFDQLQTYFKHPPRSVSLDAQIQNLISSIYFLGGVIESLEERVSNLEDVKQNPK